jgi:hypothetical protein
VIGAIFGGLSTAVVVNFLEVMDLDGNRFVAQTGAGEM